MSSLSILINSVLKSASDRLAISILLSPFAGVLICSFLVSSIWQPLYVYFCVLLRASLTPFAHLLCWKRQSYVFTRVGQPASSLCGAVCGRVVREEIMPSDWLLLHSSHFPDFLYEAGTLLTAILVLNSRVGELVSILGPSGSFKHTLLRDWQFLPHPQPPLVFTARSYKALICLALESWAARSGLGLGSFTPQVSLQVFICHM